MRKSSLITKANSRRAWRNKQLARFGLFALGVIAVGMVLPALFSTVAELVMSPVTVVRVWFTESSDSLPQYFQDRSALLARISELEAALSVRSSSDLTIRRLQAENEQLRNMLGAPEEERLLASVIARPPLLPYDHIQIDRGRADAVAEGMPVFSGQDQVIGVVTHVADHYSFVTLVTAPDFRSTVFVFGPDIYTEALGMGGGVLRVRVPQGVPLERTNLVVLPATDSGVFGEVSVVETVPTEPEQYGYVTAVTPVQELRYVSVGTHVLGDRTFASARAAVEGVQQTYFMVPVPEDQLVRVSTSTATSTASTSTSADTDTE